MRVLLGLSALVAVNGQFVTTTGSVSGATPVLGNTIIGGAPTVKLSIWQTSAGGLAPTLAPSSNPATAIAANGALNGGGFLPSSSWTVNVPNSINTVVITAVTSSNTAQLQHRWLPNYPNPATAYSGYGFSQNTYTCDSCTGGTTPISCNPGTGPGSTGVLASPYLGYNCASLTRTYTFSGLVQSVAGQAQTVNSFSIQVYDNNFSTGSAGITASPNTSSYSFTIIRFSPPIVGDPQIVGLQGQDFQVHGTPDEIFNMITYPNLQVNARFVYLSSGACHDNFTACFAHPGTYIAEEGIRLGSDKILVKSGSFKKGLTVSVNGQKLASSTASLKLGSVKLVSHRRVVITTPIMSISISNSDKFLNQETTLYDSKLLALGASRKVLADGESFHAEVPLHGLQGQTWRNVEYPSGLEYEGSISDYQINDGNLFGSNFVFNQFKQ